MHRFDEDIQLARRLDDPGQEQLPEHLISAGGLADPQHLVAAGQPVPQPAVRPRGRHRQRTTPALPGACPSAVPIPRSGCSCLAAIRCHSTAFSSSSSTSSCADPMCSISPNPLRRMHDLPPAAPPSQSSPSAHGATRKPPYGRPGPRFGAQIPADPPATALVSGPTPSRTAPIVSQVRSELVAT